MIRAENLTKKYGSTVAVGGVSFDIKKGETYGLLGPNGAGKTTTINMLVGFLKPDQGKIGINGNDDPTRSEVRMEIGHAPQDLAIYEELTAEENLSYFGKLYGLFGARLKERVTWSLEFAVLTDHRCQFTKTFSGGMKRRLNMACALVHDPAILLLDEPTVGVDPQSRNLIFDSIEELKKTGRTIVYTTHYMEEAQRLCDRVAIIDRGKIMAEDSVTGLIEEYGGLSVIEGELESPPENRSLLPGHLDGVSWRMETDRPMKQFAELAEAGIKFSRVNIVSADLETVFLNLTGRRLRD
nr:ABC transporter ATP-binding protein [candidate division Zixibacteria bacterium]